MAKYVLFLLFIFFIVFIISTNLLKLRSKVILSSMIIVILCVGYYLESNSQMNAQKRKDTIFKFNSGEKINCLDYVVDSENFSFSYASSSFIGKKDSKYKGLVIDIKECF